MIPRSIQQDLLGILNTYIATYNKHKPEIEKLELPEDGQEEVMIAKVTLAQHNHRSGKTLASSAMSTIASMLPSALVPAKTKDLEMVFTRQLEVILLTQAINNIYLSPTTYFSRISEIIKQTVEVIWD